MARAGGLPLIEPWFAPFTLVNGAALGLTPILLPVAASSDGVGHVGLVMGAFNLGAFAAPASRWGSVRVSQFGRLCCCGVSSEKAGTCTRKFSPPRVSIS